MTYSHVTQWKGVSGLCAFNRFNVWMDTVDTFKQGDTHVGIYVCVSEEAYLLKKALITHCDGCMKQILTDSIWTSISELYKS